MGALHALLQNQKVWLCIIILSTTSHLLLDPISNLSSHKPRGLCEPTISKLTPPLRGTHFSTSPMCPRGILIRSLATRVLSLGQPETVRSPIYPAADRGSRAGGGNKPRARPAVSRCNHLGQFSPFTPVRQIVMVMPMAQFPDRL